jgi:hypothetical protein
MAMAPIIGACLLTCECLERHHKPLRTITAFAATIHACQVCWCRFNITAIVALVTLTTPSATGPFLSHHLAVQQSSVFDCQGIAAGCAVSRVTKAQANQLHLLIRPDDASRLPKLMHWFGWYSAMALTRLSGRCGHFWEAR